MVNLPGHLAVALLWALPAWIVWDGRASVLAVGLMLATAMLPDVDLVLQRYAPITHHGVTHTVVFVLGTSLVAGAVVEFFFKPRLQRTWLRAESYRLPAGALFVFVAGAFAAGGLSHLFADMLSAPDVAKPVSPFWPVFAKPVTVDVIWYNSIWWNQGLLLVALALHAVLAYADVKVDHPFRIRRQE